MTTSHVCVPWRGAGRAEMIGKCIQCGSRLDELSLKQVSIPREKNQSFLDSIREYYSALGYEVIGIKVDGQQINLEVRALRSVDFYLCNIFIPDDVYDFHGNGD